MNNENPNVTPLGGVSSMIISITSHVIIALMFLGALINPQDNINFIYNSALFIFIAEFMSIHSSLMIRSENGLKSNTFMLLIYILIITIFSLALNSLYPGMLLSLNIIANIFNNKSKNKSNVVTSLILSGSLIMLLTLFSGVIKQYIVFPASVLNQRPGNISRIIC